MKKTIISLSVLAATVIAGSVSANQVNINVTGRVIASPCTTINGGSNSVSVDLKDIQATDLASANSTATENKRDFSIPFTGCPLGTDNITATFSGTSDTVDTEGWKNIAEEAAENTSVRLYKQGDTAPIKNGDELTVAVNDGAASFDLSAAAYSKAGSVTPGNISTVIVASFTYQ